ncbi:helix-turn-helix domain-containing protein [Streptomyces sp. NPDC088727]|uniref:helix-turn-helix domain-containing protein n=1 Tax=Streptomyces sp. NPDC088727 TaxID=3365875 RepID=UPI0037FF84C8
MTGPAPECVALAEGLRDMRARTGLSLAVLAERTAYSKSSWERYLNGKSPVPRQAVDVLCAMAGEPAGRLLALWELADAEWSGRARRALPAARPTPAPAPADTGAPGSGPAGPGRVRRQWLFTVAVGAAAVVTAALLTASAVRGRGTDPPASPASPVLDPEPGCQGKTCDGKDPAQMFCGLPGRATSLVPQRRTASGARMEIRYSPVCAAAWGRIWHAKTGDAVEISTSGARPRRVVVMSTSDTGAYRFTRMIGGPDRTGLHLCFLPAAGPEEECVDS